MKLTSKAKSLRSHKYKIGEIVNIDNRKSFFRTLPHHIISGKIINLTFDANERPCYYIYIFESERSYLVYPEEIIDYAKVKVKVKFT